MSHLTTTQSPLARPGLPPGPNGAFFLGMLPTLRRDMLQMYADLGRQYGDVVRVPFAGVDTFAVYRPEHFKHVLQDNNKNYRRNEFLMRILRLFIGDSLFTTDGDSWLSRRRLMQPAFHRQRIAAFGRLMTGAAEAMLAEWDRGPYGQRLAIDHEMMQLTLRVAGQALFSVDLLGSANRLGEAFTEMSEFINYRLRQPFALPVFIPTRANRKFHHARRVIDGAIDAMLRERRASGEDRDDLLGLLMQARDADTGEAMTDEQLHNEIAVMMFAGHETTAVTLTWALYLLSQHPEVEARLHAEVDSVLGGRTPTMDDLPRLPYTRMVLEETMRLYPPAFGITRNSIGPDEFDGYRIPANASVTLMVINAHRDPRYWRDPERFDPLRFAPERAAERHPFAYLPFGAGPRMCIGNVFAMTEAQLVLASIAQRYRLRLVPGHPVKPNPLFVLRTSHGLPMFAERRQG